MILTRRALLTGSAALAASSALGQSIVPAVQAYVEPPAGAGPFPAVVYVHGGGWTSVNNPGGFALGPYFNGMGATFIRLVYRLSPSVPAKVLVFDIIDAVNYINANASALNIQANNIVLMGHSSGAFLAAAAGFVLGKWKIKGVVACDAPSYDIYTDTTRVLSSDLLDPFGQTAAECAPHMPKWFLDNRVRGIATRYHLLYSSTYSGMMETAGQTFKSQLTSAGFTATEGDGSAYGHYTLMEAIPTDTALGVGAFVADRLGL